MLNILKIKKKYTPLFQQIDNKSIASQNKNKNKQTNKQKKKKEEQKKKKKEIQEINNSVPSWPYSLNYICLSKKHREFENSITHVIVIMHLELYLSITQTQLTTQNLNPSIENKAPSFL